MNVVITGANRGIGIALTQAYLNQGATVIALCRTTSETLGATDAQIIEGIDVTDDESIETLAHKLNMLLGDGAAIDILINNAGIMLNESLDAMRFSNIEKQFAINSVAPLKLTYHLLPLLKAGSKLALVTSRMGSMADNSSGGYYGYRMSKAALNAVGVSLAHDLKPKGIAVALLHPGYVQTDMALGGGEITADHAARGLVDRIGELTIASSGGFWHSNGDTLPW